MPVDNPLFANKINNLFHFRCIHKCTLQTGKFSIIGNKHISFTNQLFGTTGIQDGTASQF